MSDTSAARRQQLSPAKQALLNRWMGRSSEGARVPAISEAKRIPPRPTGASAPLSFQQQRLWRELEAEGKPSFYNNAVRFRGHVDVAALSRALNEIIRRHEVLRTTFSIANSQIVQVVHAPQPTELTAEDWRGVPAEERESKMHAKAMEQAGPFDLERGPLFRTALLRLGETEYVLLFTLLHIISDAWSIELLDHELSVLYNAYSSAHLPTLPELPIQYADYAYWQREALGSDALAQQVSYWQEQLRDCPSVLPLPTDFPRPARQTFNAGYESILLPAEELASLRSVALRESATLFMTLLAALKVLLRARTGRDDVPVATGVAGRQHVETERLVGCFINTLVVRTDLSGDPAFANLLGRVRERCLGAFANQEVPFQMVVEQLQPSPIGGYPPLVQVSFALHQERPRESVSASSLKASLSVMDVGRAALDLTLRAAESEQGLDCTLEYNRDLFRPATIRQMLDDYLTLLRQVGSNPARRLSELSIDDPRSNSAPLRTTLTTLIKENV
jgi:hypothetical protein